MKESSRVRSLLITFAIIVLGIPMIANATSPVSITENGTVRVSFSDLDLASDAGVEALYNRLRGAARAACGEQHSMTGAGSIKQLVRNRKCYADTLSELVAKVNNVKLAKVHAGLQKDRV